MVVGMRNAENREQSSALPRYDVKPGRFALNQGSRKLCSGGVTCPGLIHCAGLEQLYCIVEAAQIGTNFFLHAKCLEIM